MTAVPFDSAHSGRRVNLTPWIIGFGVVATIVIAGLALQAMVGGNEVPVPTDDALPKGPIPTPSPPNSPQPQGPNDPFEKPWPGPNVPPRILPRP